MICALLVLISKYSNKISWRTWDSFSLGCMPLRLRLWGWFIFLFLGFYDRLNEISTLYCFRGFNFEQGTVQCFHLLIFFIDCQERFNKTWILNQISTNNFITNCGSNSSPYTPFLNGKRFIYLDKFLNLLIT